MCFMRDKRRDPKCDTYLSTSDLLVQYSEQITMLTKLQKYFRKHGLMQEKRKFSYWNRFVISVLEVKVVGLD